jgi:transcriptional regulator with XRE-family HTH domain
MSITSSYPAYKFGSIYKQAMESQLQKIGSNLAALREARNEDISTVANAVDLGPGLLEQIESGQHDFRLKTLFALCDYYDTDLESVVSKGELLNFRFV